MRQFASVIPFFKHVKRWEIWEKIPVKQVITPIYPVTRSTGVASCINLASSVQFLRMRGKSECQWTKNESEQETRRAGWEEEERATSSPRHVFSLAFLFSISCDLSFIFTHHFTHYLKAWNKMPFSEVNKSLHCMPVGLTAWHSDTLAGILHWPVFSLWIWPLQDASCICWARDIPLAARAHHARTTRLPRNSSNLAPRTFDSPLDNLGNRTNEYDCYYTKVACTRPLVQQGAVVLEAIVELTCQLRCN